MNSCEIARMAMAAAKAKYIGARIAFGLIIGVGALAPMKATMSMAATIVDGKKMRMAIRRCRARSASTTLADMPALQMIRSSE